MIADNEAFWMVWNLARNAPMVRHKMQHDARREADRLAMANPGETFYVVRAESAHRSVEVQTIELKEPIPF